MESIFVEKHLFFSEAQSVPKKKKQFGGFIYMAKHLDDSLIACNINQL